jgi:hypothetical protein
MIGVLNHLIDAFFSWPVFALAFLTVGYKFVMALVVAWRVTDV